MKFLDMKIDGPVECQGFCHDGHIGFFSRTRFGGVVFEMLEEEQEDRSLTAP